MVVSLNQSSSPFLAVMFEYHTSLLHHKNTFTVKLLGKKQLTFSLTSQPSSANQETSQAHVETGEYIHTIPTAQPASCVAWHPNRYWLAYSGDPAGLKIVGAAGGPL